MTDLEKLKTLVKDAGDCMTNKEGWDCSACPIREHIPIGSCSRMAEKVAFDLLIKNMWKE